MEEGTFQLRLGGQVGFGGLEIWGEGTVGTALRESSGNDRQQRKEADQRREHQASRRGL